MRQEDELELVTEESLKTFFEKNVHRMRNFAKAILRDDYYTDEAVQGAFVVAWMRRNDFDGKGSLRGWIYGILVNKIRDAQKERNKMRRLLVSYEEHADQCPVEMAMDVNTTLSGVIPKQEFAVLKRLYVDNFTYQEMSEELGIPLSTFGMRVKRSKEKFKENYEK